MTAVIFIIVTDPARNVKLCAVSADLSVSLNRGRAG